jgi:hypothetical protein
MLNRDRTQMPSRAVGKHGLIIPFLAARSKATIHAQP